MLKIGTERGVIPLHLANVVVFLTSNTSVLTPGFLPYAIPSKCNLHQSCISVLHLRLLLNSPKCTNGVKSGQKKIRLLGYFAGSKSKTTPISPIQHFQTRMFVIDAYMGAKSFWLTSGSERTRANNTHSMMLLSQRQILHFLFLYNYLKPRVTLEM